MKKRFGFMVNEDLANQLRHIPSKDFKTFVLAMTNFFLYDIDPPTFSGKTAIIASFVFEQLARSKAAIESGRKGGMRTAEKSKKPHNI